MTLLPITAPEHFETVAAWLAESRNNRWLHFGPGVQSLSAAVLSVMVQKDSHVLRLFTPDEDYRTAIGVVGLSDVDRLFKVGNLWFVLGDKRYGGRGHTLRATSKMLTLGFGELGLGAIQAWAVDGNHGSLKILRNLNFRLIGRQRQCHYMDGLACDRLWFDLLASEHEVIDYV